MKIIPYGSISHYGELDIEAETVADAIEGWSCQVGLDQVPLFQKMVIDVVGFDTEEKLFAKTDVKVIHLLPSMFGGGGAFGKILLGAALIGLSLIPGGVVGTMLLGKFALGVMAAGIGMVLSGVMQIFMKAPTVSKSDDPEASKYLGSGTNTTEIGTLIPKGYGRMLLGGHYLSIQVNSNDMVHGVFPDTVPT